MHDIKTISVNQKILDSNDKIAHSNKHYLHDKNIFTINIMGAPGIGKTTIIIKICEILKEKSIGSFVIEGDIESSIDTEKLNKIGIPAFQINTFGACHLDAPLIHNSINNIDLGNGGILLIENVGNLVCPAEFEIGEDIKILITSVTEGSDKPYKYPLSFEKADIIILNKTDLIPYTDFDFDYYEKGIRNLNDKAKIIKVNLGENDSYKKIVDEILCLKK